MVLSEREVCYDPGLYRHPDCIIPPRRQREHGDMTAAANCGADKAEPGYTSGPDRFLIGAYSLSFSHEPAPCMLTAYGHALGWLVAIPEHDCVTRSGLKRVVFNISYGDTQDSVAPQEQLMNY